MDQPPYRDVTVGDLLTRLARALPDRDALVYGERPRFTFGALEREARTVARGLMALGVEPGERVVLWATNVPEWVVLQFALAKVGAILVTANTSLRARDIEYVLRQSEAATLITIRGFRDVDYVGELAAIGVPRRAGDGPNPSPRDSARDEKAASSGGIATLGRQIFVGDEPPPDFVPYADLRLMAGRVSEAELDARGRGIGADDVINMQYTSGTTGFPKGVMLSSRNIVNNGEALGSVLGFTPADRLCLCVPLFHCFGCVIGVLGAFSHGACLCPIEAFDAKRVLETIHRERCTALYGVPTMFIAELEYPAFAAYDLTSLRTGVMAGALCPEPLMRRVMNEMHMPEVTIAYGMTESSPGITMTPRDSSVAQRSQTVGPVLPELEVKIVDPATGVERTAGERGELCCRGYNVMKGYYNDPDATRAAIDAHGWLHTGDEATRDPDGYFRITGRIKDIIIRGGENVAPKEIEDRLREHEAVADAYVYGVEDAFFGEAVAAAVRLKPDAANEGAGREGTRCEVPRPEELIAWCASALAKFKVPRYVRFVSEFPMTASGKIQKYKLREEHQRLLSLKSEV
ncbi:MAG: AMP-binding protein [Acidobacteria bacterium]|nr:MAG: AMP-binding protein [Acidobacteriota bacterium]